MKIIKFQKKKSNIYTLYLEDNSKVDIPEEVIFKYDLLLKKVFILTPEITEAIDYYNSYELAIKYLTNKMRTKNEIINYLQKKETSNFNIAKIIDDLEEKNYLDDNSYVKAYINDKISFTNDGPSKIVYDLENKGIKEAIIYNNISIFTKELQEDKIKNIIKKQELSNRNKGNMYLKNKISSYLNTQGYDRELSNKLLNSYTFKEDDNLREKEYQKVYEKIKKKNPTKSEKEIEFLVKQKMYSLGFKL